MNSRDQNIRIGPLFVNKGALTVPGWKKPGKKQGGVDRGHGTKDNDELQRGVCIKTAGEASSEKGK